MSGSEAFDVVVARRRAGRRDRRRPGGRRRPERRAGRAAPGRRRVLLLRLHAVEGAAAPGGAAGGGRSGCPGVREAVTGELDVEAALRRRDEVIHGPRRLEPDAVARGAWHRAVPRAPGRSTASAGCGPGDDRSRGAPRGRRRDRLAARRCRRSPGCTSHGPGATARPPRPRPRPGRLLVLGGGVVGVELAQAWASLGSSGDAGRGGSPADRGRGAIRLASRWHGALRELGVDVRTAPR